MKGRDSESLGLEKVVEKGAVRNRGGEKGKDYVGR